MKRLIIIDTHNLAFRAAYALGGLSHEGVATEALYGVFRDVAKLWNDYAPCTFVFTFEGGRLLRLDHDAGYKGNRKPKTPQEAANKGRLLGQLNILGSRLLGKIGFSNVFRKSGYEADDLIAAVCRATSGEYETRIVSTDQDLYQLLDLNTIILKPGSWRVYNLLDFKAEWGVNPGHWPRMKALAGDDTDNVRGLPGVGLKTAAKYLTGGLRAGTKAHTVIMADVGATEARNLPLVTLPWAGLGSPKLRPDRVRPRQWDETMKTLGIKSLLGAIS